MILNLFFVILLIFDYLLLEKLGKGLKAYSWFYIQIRSEKKIFPLYMMVITVKKCLLSYSTNGFTVILWVYVKILGNTMYI